MGGNEMNCAVCGKPLPFDRVVFHCSCGAYVHGYCWDKHVLDAHQPSFEKGTVDLNGDFQAIEPTLPDEFLDKRDSSLLMEADDQESIEKQIQENDAEELQGITSEE
jgi:hypothetical protein